jgi:hypothetical protein
MMIALLVARIQIPMLGIWVRMNIVKEWLIFMSFWVERDEGSNCNGQLNW